MCGRAESAYKLEGFFVLLSVPGAVLFMGVPLLLLDGFYVHCICACCVHDTGMIIVIVLSCASQK